jgi:hypothetical protein
MLQVPLFAPNLLDGSKSKPYVIAIPPTVLQTRFILLPILQHIESVKVSLTNDENSAASQF